MPVIGLMAAAQVGFGLPDINGLPPKAPKAEGIAADAGTQPTLVAGTASPSVPIDTTVSSATSAALSAFLAQQQASLKPGEYAFIGGTDNSDGALLVVGSGASPDMFAVKLGDDGKLDPAFKQAMSASLTKQFGRQGGRYYSYYEKLAIDKLTAEKANPTAAPEQMPEIVSALAAIKNAKAAQAISVAAVSATDLATAASNGSVSSVMTQTIAHGSDHHIVKSKLPVQAKSPVVPAKIGVTPAKAGKQPKLMTGVDHAAQQAKAAEAQAAAAIKQAAAIAKTEASARKAKADIARKARLHAPADKLHAAAGEHRKVHDKATKLRNKANRIRVRGHNLAATLQTAYERRIAGLTTGAVLVIAGAAALLFRRRRKNGQKPQATVDTAQPETLALPAPFAAPEATRHQFRPADDVLELGAPLDTASEPKADMNKTTHKGGIKQLIEDKLPLNVMDDQTKIDVQVAKAAANGRSVAAVAEPHANVIQAQQDGHRKLPLVPAEAFVVDDAAAAKDKALTDTALHLDETGIDCFSAGTADDKAAAPPVSIRKVGGFALLMGAIAAGSTVAILAAKQHIDEAKSQPKRPGPLDARLGSYAGPARN